VSKSAAACPHCGHKTDGSSLAFTVVIVLVVLMFWGIAKMTPDPDPGTAPTVHKAMTDQEKIEAQFSARDDSHRALTAYIKEHMNNPESFEHVDTGFKKDAAGNLLVKTVFRGTNAFGGVVTNQVVARVDLDGNILQIVSTVP
jgi:hypothetical protein